MKIRSRVSIDVVSVNPLVKGREISFQFIKFFCEGIILKRLLKHSFNDRMSIKYDKTSTMIIIRYDRTCESFSLQTKISNGYF